MSAQEVIIGYAPPDGDDAPVLRPFRPGNRVLKSELAEITNEAWTDFVLAMKVGRLDSVSPSNGLGMFDMRYKRLADLGLVENLGYKRDPVINRSVQVADWVAPHTRERFLGNAGLQLRVFTVSCRAYFRDLCSGTLKAPPGVTASGALAILHRGGRALLEKWSDPEQQFEQTRDLVSMVNGIF